MLLAYLLVFLAILAALPLVRYRLLPGPGNWAAALAAAFGASVGGLTLWMLLLGVLPGRALSPLTASIFPAVLWVAGVWAALRGGGPQRAESPLAALLAWVRQAAWTERWLLLAIAGSLAASFTHSLYYPFVGEDEVTRYALYARQIFTAGAIPPAIADYPLLLPLGYAYAFFVSGGVNEHLAKLISWGFAPATVCASYWLTSIWAGRRAGLVAAFTLAVTRLFVDWSPMGYVDIPSALYFALVAGFVSLWLQQGRARYALAAGVAAGLALWTKQAGFAAVLSLGVVCFGVGLWDSTRRRAAWGVGLLALALAGVVGLPWYARTALLWGWQTAVPGPGGFYYQQARRTVLDWLPFLAWAEEWGYAVAPIYLVGLLAAVASLAALTRSASPNASAASKSRITHHALRVTPDVLRFPTLLLLLVFLLPYLALWWNWFSYDPRFLLTVLPFYAALVGIGFEWAASRVPLKPSLALTALTAALAVGLLYGGTYTRLGGGYRLLTAPFATDEEKLLHYKPDVASTVAFLLANSQPGQTRIYSMDPRLGYYLFDYDFKAGYPTTLSELAGYDYLVAGSWAVTEVYPRLGAADNEVVAHLDDPQVLPLLFTSELGTVKVYRVQIPSSQSER